MATDTWTAPRLLARQGLRRCVVCEQARDVALFAGSNSRKCDVCKAAPKVRACRSCGEDRPVAEFVRRGSKCETCKTADVGPPRHCLRCHEFKAADAFPWGKGHGRGCYRRRRGVCTDCLDEEARERAEADQRAAARRVTWETPDGRLVRRCSGCDKTKDLEADFYNTRKPKPGESLISSRSYRCKRCTIDRVGAYAKARAADPATRSVVLAQRRRWQRSYRARNPKAYRDAQIRYEQAVLADPKRHARQLENARIAYRLKRERDGLPVRGGLSTATRGRDEQITLPPAPLVDLVDSIIARSPGQSAENVCLGLGISERLLYRWRTESESVRFRLADVVLTHVGRHVWDVWPQDVYPEVHEAIFG